MTIGYYAILPPTTRTRRPRTEPWPFCRACVERLQAERVVGIDEDASPSLTCRGCKAKLRDWR